VLLCPQDYNTKLFDFSMVSGGMFPDRNKVRLDALCGYTGGCIGYVSTCFAYTGMSTYFFFFDKYTGMSTYCIH
jgi:hypothetical protein